MKRFVAYVLLIPEMINWLGMSPPMTEAALKPLHFR
jgi:hypothetical protein